VAGNRKDGKERQESEKWGRIGLHAVWRMMCLISASFLKFICLVAILGIISLSFLIGYHYLLTSSHIRLERVIITGVDEDIERDLLTMAHLGSNISLLAVNTVDLEAKLEKHPWVRKVALEKQYPDTLIIRAEKEEPWAIVSMGPLYYLNRQGAIFKKLDSDEAVDYPVLTGFVPDDPGQARKLLLAARVLRTFESQEEPWSLKDISEVFIRESGNVSIYFRNIPAEIKVKVQNLGEKLDALRQVVAHLSSTGRVQAVKRINLHYRDGAVVCFKKKDGRDAMGNCLNNGKKQTANGA
jgi:cell division protein FtsQ